MHFFIPSGTNVRKLVKINGPQGSFTFSVLNVPVWRWTLEAAMFWLSCWVTSLDLIDLCSCRTRERK